MRVFLINLYHWIVQKCRIRPRKMVSQYHGLVGPADTASKSSTEHCKMSKWLQHWYSPMQFYGIDGHCETSHTASKKIVSWSRSGQHNPFSTQGHFIFLTLPYLLLWNDLASGIPIPQGAALHHGAYDVIFKLISEVSRMILRQWRPHEVLKSLAARNLQWVAKYSVNLMQLMAPNKVSNYSLICALKRRFKDRFESPSYAQ
jgi:hypothetical protein